MLEGKMSLLGSDPRGKSYIWKEPLVLPNLESEYQQGQKAPRFALNFQKLEKRALDMTLSIAPRPLISMFTTA